MSTGFVRAAALAELRAGPRVVRVAGRPILLLLVDGQVRAVDNRCPHMGYPLSRGTVRDGIVRCAWHHWQFDLQSGGCLVGGPYDLPTYPVEVRGEEVWVRPEPAAPPGDAGAALRRLRLALEQADGYLVAKAVADLLAEGVPPRELWRLGAEVGLRSREGFGRGMVILACTARLLPYARDDEDRALALVHGLTQAARDAADRPPRRPQWALPASGAGDRVTLVRRFRAYVDDREPQGAERLLRTAAAAGWTLPQLAALLTLSATDHLFLDTGHVLDFVNKACELADLAGEDRAADLLAALVPGMADAFRHEEDPAWAEAEPHLRRLEAELPDLLSRAGRPAAADRAGGGTVPDPAAERELAERLAREDPAGALDAAREALAAGWGLRTLSRALLRAGIHRLARYPEHNEQDWDDVHHAFSYNQAVAALVERAAGALPDGDVGLARAVLHGAVYTALTRFLNVPRAREPREAARELPDGGAGALLERLLAGTEFRRVDEAGAAAWRYLEEGHPDAPLLGALVRALLREDAAFHTYQAVEAAISAYRRLGPGDPDGRLALAAAARFVAAQRARRILLSHVQHALTLRHGGEPAGEEDPA